VKLLTKDDFEYRLAQLTDAREAAQAEFRKANLAIVTGSGTDADVTKAKGDLDLVEGRLQGLHSAWTESQRLQAEETRQAKRKSFAKFEKAVAAQLDICTGSASQITEAATALAASLKAHAQAVKEIKRLAGTEFHYTKLNGLFLAVDSGMDAGRIAGGVLGREGIAPNMITGDMHTLNGRHPVDIQAERNSRIAASAAQLAPSED
jgi:hypothetical protein